jgi:hypothetical protein
MVDLEALHRARRFLQMFEVETHEYLFQAAVGERRALTAIRTHARPGVDRIREIVEWPSAQTSDWSKGFLAGVFDAEGSYSRGILRICNTDMAIIDRMTAPFQNLDFDFIVETRSGQNKRVHVGRIRRGLRAPKFFRFHPHHHAEARHRRTGARERRAPSGVSVEPSASSSRFTTSTGTGDFIADGVVSHNCHARTVMSIWGSGRGRTIGRS